MNAVEARLQKLRNNWPEEVSIFLVFKPENRRYLSGFTGSSAVLAISEQDQYLITDFRYFEQAKHQSPHWQIYPQETTLPQAIKTLIKEKECNVIALEADGVTLALEKTLKQGMEGREFILWENRVEKLRAVKDENEIQRLAHAVALADEGFDHICRFIKAGMREREIALELEFFLRKQGAEGVSFEFIVASGPRGALPHGIASGKRLEIGDLVTIDFGCVLDGYCSDTTRTLVVGKPDEKQKEIYNIVLEAQKKALQAISAGKTGQEIDAIARKVITDAGYGEAFGHGLGHGVGLVVHEEPRLSKLAEGVLEAGHVVTVEPGIYLPGWGGVRIEDMVVVTSQGHQNLTRAPKELLSI